MSEYRKRGRIKLSAFWLRRARRLLPALLIVLVVVTLMVRFAEPAGLYPDFRTSALSALFYFSNWWQIAASGNYFVTTGAVSPLTHTWSLAVEEQFYLVWPLVVLAVMTLSRSFVRGIRVLSVVSVAGAVASIAEMALLYSPTANITRLYFGTDTHAQSIFIGSALACSLTIIQMRRGARGWPRSPGPRWPGRPSSPWDWPASPAPSPSPTSRTASRPSTTGRVHAVGAVGRGHHPRGGVRARGPHRLDPLAPTAGVDRHHLLWRLPLALPGLHLLRRRPDRALGFPLLLVRFACTFGLAAVSFYLVERPVMYGTFWRSLKAAVPATALLVATVVVVVAGTAIPATASPARSAVSSLPGAERQSLLQASAFSSHPVRFLLLGDSIAFTLGVGLGVDSVPRYGVDVINRGDLGCDLDDLKAYSSGFLDTPVSNCNHWRSFFAQEISRNRPDVVGLLVGRWDITNHVDNGQIVHIGEPAWNTHLYNEISQVVDVLSATGAKVVLLTMPDLDPQESPNGTPYPENDPVRVTEFNQIVTRVAAHKSSVATLVNLNKVIDPGGHYQSVIDGVTVRWADGIHISKPGGEWLQSALLPTVAQLGLDHRTTGASN